METVIRARIYETIDDIARVGGCLSGYKHGPRTMHMEVLDGCLPPPGAEVMVIWTRAISACDGEDLARAHA